MKSPTLTVRCVECLAMSHRRRRDDGSLRPCSSCGGAVVVSTAKEDKRIAKAKSDLAAWQEA